MKAIFKIVYFLFVACVVAVALLLVASLMPIPGNFKVKVVKSGSMEPALMTGGIVVIRPVSSYHVNDIITFGPDTKTQVPTTHRIILTTGTGAEESFTTKGDANEGPDSEPTLARNVQGKVIFSAPYAGYVLDFARKPLGFALLVGVPALIVIIEEIAKIVGEIRRIRHKKKMESYVKDPN